jgi:hypothetical protein
MSRRLVELYFQFSTSIKHIATSGRNLGEMAFPSPTQAPNDFRDYLKSLNLNLALNTFSHYQNRPIETLNGRLIEDTAQQWCERMDSLLVTTWQLH